MDKALADALAKDRNQVIDMADEFAMRNAKDALLQWRELGEYLMVKYVDGVEKGMERGRFMQNDQHIPDKVIRRGYSQEYIDQFLVKPNPERFRQLTKEEMDQRK